MANVLAEATGVVLAPETTLKSPPTANWMTLQPNPGGIQGWEPKFKTVERDPLSPFATPEKGDNVGLDVDLTLTCDWNKDTCDLVGETMFRCAAAHAGNKGLSLYRPTAVTATGYTVPALGDLTQNTLIYARGFTNSANDGLKTVAAASAALEIKASGLTVEASPPANATVDVVGFQFPASDLSITYSGGVLALNSASSALATKGISVGAWLYFPTPAEALAMGDALYGFDGVSGRARVKSVSAAQIVLERSTFTPAADAGTNKTIRLFIPSRFYRNYPLTDTTNYKKATLHGELSEIGAGTAGAATYTYAQGMALDTAELTLPLEDKIVLQAKYTALDVPDPVLLAGRLADGAGRGTGPGTAFSPLAAALTDTATDLKQIRLTNSAGTLLGEINSATFRLANSARARKALANFGGIDHNYGKFMFSVSMEAYYSDFNVVKALRSNPDLSWDAFAKNHQWAWQLDLPYVALRNGGRSYQANEPVMITCDVPAFRNANDNIAGSLSVFGYLPSA